MMYHAGLDDDTSLLGCRSTAAAGILLSGQAVKAGSNRTGGGLKRRARSNTVPDASPFSHTKSAFDIVA